MPESGIASTLLEWSPNFVEPRSAELSRIPEQWLPIVMSPDPDERRRTALALWNQSFLDLLPDFTASLRTRFVDVRCCISDDCPALVYVAEADNGKHVSWVGHDPRSFGDPPQFWDSFPAPLQVFLSEVHAGFVSGTINAFGPSRSRHMETLANLADYPEGIPGWDDDAEIPSTRLLSICTDGGILHYCSSPDLEPRQIALVYEGDVDPLDFSAEFDELLMSRIKYYRP